MRGSPPSLACCSPGLTPEGSFVEREAPPNPDGSSTRKIFWAPLDGDEPTLGHAAETVRLTGAAPDAILVWHADVTRE